MHRTIFFLLAAFFLAIVPASSQDIAAVSDSLTTDSVQAELPFRVTLYSPDAHITLAIDLYEESVNVPGYEFFGPTFGYMRGDARQWMYGVWFVLSAEIKENKAILRMSNDSGAASQDVELRIMPDGTYAYRALGTNEVSRAEGRKLKKIQTKMTFVKQQ